MTVSWMCVILPQVVPPSVNLIPEEEQRLTVCVILPQIVPPSGVLTPEEEQRYKSFRRGGRHSRMPASQ
jgi:hypothetical protein